MRISEDRNDVNGKKKCSCQSVQVEDAACLLGVLAKQPWGLLL